ncbi:MAG: S49 family peptidase [Gemmataceae bacterium]
MRNSVVLLLGLVGLAGGCGPFHICTNSRVRVEEPIHTVSRVITENPPIVDGGPVREMVVQPARRCAAAKVAVVDVDGLLMNTDMTGPSSLGDNPVSIFREKLDAIAADPCVRAVVLRINTPGGGVTASDIMWHELRRFKAQCGKPVVACLMDLGTGGGYYLATGADWIIAHPTTVTGGIGVILNLYNLQDAMGYFNIIGQPIKAGNLIDMGTPIAPLEAEAGRLLQAMADDFHQRFIRVVEQMRPQVQRDEASTFDGRVFTAAQALERKLIDQIGYLDDAIQTAQQLAQVPDAAVVLFHRCNDPAYSPYAVSPNVPLQSAPLMPLSLPGLDRTRLPTFLYIWQPEATLEKLSGK